MSSGFQLIIKEINAFSVEKLNMSEGRERQSASILKNMIKNYL